MKIFHLDRQKSWTGQINRQFQIVTGLLKRGFDMGVIAQSKSRMAERCREAGIPVFTFPMQGWLFNITVLRLGFFLRGQQVDILHCHGPRDNLLALIAGRMAGVRHVVRTKHNHKELRSGRWSRMVYERCSRVVTVSEFIRQSLIRDGVDPAHVETIHTAVNLERFSPRPRNGDLARELGIRDGELVIGCVSSLHARKGIEEILRACKIIVDSRPDRPVRCFLVGKKWKRWVPLARELGITDRVTFTGFQREVADVLALFDVYVLPSRDEGLGTSILEAMAMGLPVIVSDVGGIPEAVADGTGIVIPAHDYRRLAKELTALLADPDRRSRLGRAARERVEGLFSLETLVEHTAQLYTGIMQ